MLEVGSLNESQRTAAILRAVADALLMPVASATGLNPDIVQSFVEGSSVGAVEAAKKPRRKGKVSAYNRAFRDAYRRRRARHSKQNGDLKKGYDHQRLMALAHQDTRKALKGKR